MSTTKHTVIAPSGVFRDQVSSPYAAPEGGKSVYVSRRKRIKPFVVAYTLNGGASWAINSWHGRRDLAEKERRRLGYDEGDAAARAVILYASY